MPRAPFKSISNSFQRGTTEVQFLQRKVQSYEEEVRLLQKRLDEKSSLIEKQNLEKRETAVRIRHLQNERN